MPKIFVCHRREDTADVAGRIFDRLVMNYGDQQILKDLDSIPLGVDFREYLGRMVGECDVLLAVIGPRWLDAEGDTSRLDDPRDFVRIEIESALTREIPVVPLFVGGASMPSEEDVPESIRPFVYRNGVPVRPNPDFHDDMDRVIAGLDGYGRPAPPPPAETVAPSRPERIPPADPDSHRDAEERERVRAEAELTKLADKLAEAEEHHRAEIAHLQTKAEDIRDAAARNAQATAEAHAHDTLAAELDRVRADAERTRTDELAAAEARHRAETARLETEAAESRDAAIRDAQTAAEVRADETLAVKLDRVRADAERTLADELAAAEERHRAEIARLETEAAESRDTATRDAQARADAQADDRLTAELDRARAEAERTLADELAVAEKRHRAEIRDAAASDIETLQFDAGMMETPTPTTAARAPTILIVAEDEVQTVKSEPGFKTNIRVFADTDAIRALQCISRDRPRLVVLGRAFVDSSRGAGLVNAIKTDRTLANTQIRVISRASDYLCLVRRTGPQAASDDAMPGEPLPADYLGTRRTRRYKLRPGVEVRVDGHPTTLVDLSGTGARLAGSTVLRMKQQVRFVIGTAPEVVRCSGHVALNRTGFVGGLFP